MIFSKANAPRFTSFDSLNDRDVACRETVPSVRSGRVEVTVLENKGGTNMAYLQKLRDHKLLPEVQVGRRA